jgi:RimJ/RimL family protein N-acetyltransferase
VSERDEVYPDVHPARIEGRRIYLREVGPEDSAAAWRWASDPAFFRHMAVAPMASEADERAFLVRVEALAAERPRRHYHLGIVWMETDELIGMARISIREPEHRGGDIGYGLRRDRWGEGIATEAATLLVDFGFTELGLHRIFAYHHPENLASGRVLMKIGMQREGQLRENQLRHDGTWRDSVVYAVLEQDWRKA